MPQMRLHPLFAPRAIAVFGASDNGESVGAKAFANLMEGDFEGEVHPINPKYEKVGGRRCYASVHDAPDGVDLAVIATPAATIPQIVRDCGENGVRHAIILSAGFREAGEAGRSLERELTAAARTASVRFLGPNCVGLVRPWIGMNATFLKQGTPRGRLALISQSGALCAAISDWAAPHHLGFSAIVSLGNSADIDFGDALDYLAHDAETGAILLYVEGIQNARSFISALRIAARLKPVIVLKAGRHSDSSQAAVTHTGALMGSDAVFDAALERAGAVRARTFGELFAAAEILSETSRANGPSLAIVTNGGGPGVLAADRAGDLDLDIRAPSETTIAALDGLLPPFWSRANPIDILGNASPEIYASAVSACLADDAFDGALVMLTPQAMTDPVAVARAVRDAVPKPHRKPVLACWMGQTSVAEARTLLSEAGIPDFTTPEKAVEAFSYLARHHLNRLMAREVPGPMSELEPPDIEGARMIINTALAENRQMLSDTESKAVMRAFRIDTNTTMPAGSAAEALVAAETIGFPVAMKIQSPDIIHKSDVGGVRTGIATAADVRTAFRDITGTARQARPEAEISGVTVEAMAHIAGARELLVGVSRDAAFGPTIVFGAGGTMVEVLSDSAVSLPPLNAVLARRQIGRTRVARLLDAFRDLPAADREAIVNVLLRVSDLVCEFPEIRELDINPLMAGADGTVAVDCRISVARPPATLRRYGHLAIAAYPRNLVTSEHLADGTPITIRPIRPEDAEGEQSFVRSLSAEAKRMRFMGAINELTPEMLARFTQIDYDREMALIVTIEENGAPVQRGVARYAINPDGTSCEFAIVVSDRIQHRGIGTRLMQALMDAARQHGISTMQGAVLAENDKMLQLTRDLDFHQSVSADDPGVVHVERRLQ